MNRTRAAGFVGLTFLALATLAMLALHRARPDLDPVRTPISFYGRGSGAWLLTAGLLGSGLGVIAISWVLERRLNRRVGPWLIAVGGSALIVAATVRSDLWFPWQHRLTLTGWVHAGAAGLAAFAFPIGALLVTRDERKATGSGLLNRFLDILIFIFLVTLAAFGGVTLLFIALGRSVGFLGLAERILMALAVAWLVVASREPASSA